MHAATADDNRLLHSIPAARVALIERIVRSAATDGGRQGLAQRFLRSYFHGVAEEDLAAREPRGLSRAALAHLKFAAQRPGQHPLVRVFNPQAERDGFESPHTLVLTVSDDMPFLVDSIGMALARAHLAVHLIVHPVLQVHRDRRGRLLDLGSNGGGAAHAESWQLYEIDRVTDPEQLEKLQRDLEATLGDVRVAVRDWRAMRDRVRAVINSLTENPPALLPAEVSEVAHLLEWMDEGHFVFLGYRHYRLERGRSEDRLVPDRASGLGILSTSRRAGQRAGVTVLRGDVRERAREPELLIVTKANSTATVHRGELLDYVGVKTFDGRGRVDGEHRFVGLWTSTAYHGSPRDIPVLRRKVERVIEHFGLDPASHDGKAVLNVLETYPRDELFQAAVADLIRIVRGVVNLYERRTVRMLVRRDPYHRFYSCLVYVPRDRYNTEVRERIEKIALAGFGGTAVESQAQISGSSHARVHVVVRTDPAQQQKPDYAQIERRIAEAALTWQDRVREILIDRLGEAKGLALAGHYRQAFPLAYEEDVTPAEVLEDLSDLETLRQTPKALKLNLYRPAGQVLQRVHLKIVKLGEPVPISDVLPMLENFGLRVISERPYELKWPEGGAAWIQDFELEHRDRLVIDIERIETLFRDAFGATWSGAVENDGFNRLLLAAELNARQVVMLRAYCRYLLQTGVPFSQASMERALAGHPSIARSLVKLFETRFDPAAQRRRGNDRKAVSIATQVRAELDAVTSLDDDRILRAYLTLLQATLRTNFYQMAADGQPKAYVSFKLDPAKIPDLPLPRPKFEIFVYSPRVEGVHLRMGYVARGGIRWSDRREDFRTEVLGLMKAQNVKNTVIVPVGAKGGFVAKRLPAEREAQQAEVIACYQTLIRGLLDVTDNIVDEKIAPPRMVVRHDKDDAYLVVAADKGTATFSDIANAISQEYSFWLGDAFASGGSAGYDHKKMAITARGAWECVKRHFREMGMDTQAQTFSVCGIGDMAGDVFGNGMLQSPHIRLIAAFNHQHIFIDPQPDAASSFAERERMFNLPRSSWEDYSRKAISKGGGVFSRSAKNLSLSREAQTLLELPAQATPNDVIKAILKAHVDLLWNGGIGTYVKASGESHSDVGDRSNDAVRVDARELNCKVIGEGGNLGLSQLGRIEYARRGGRLNTDFIDNSAGVNCSDVEVNLKILLNGAVRARELTYAGRNRLLAQMTDEVAGLVLRNNYLQGQAISTSEFQTRQLLAENAYVIRALERSGDLNRSLEFLPSDEEIAERRQAGEGLTRPELAILLSYGKIWLYHALIHSDVPEDPYLSTELNRYFPAPVQSRFASRLKRHRLRREIIATAITNSLINRMGPVFPVRAQDDTGADPAAIARAYSIAREVFAVRNIWAQIEGLDNKIAASVQYTAMIQTTRLLRHMSYWLLENRRNDLDIKRAVSRYAGKVSELFHELGEVLGITQKARMSALRSQLVEQRVPEQLAARIASLEELHSALDLVEVARTARVRIGYAARAYFDLGERIGLTWIKEQIESLAADGHWQGVARGTLRENLYALQGKITLAVLKNQGRDPGSRVDHWLSRHAAPVDALKRLVADLRTGSPPDFATISVALQAVRRLAN